MARDARKILAWRPTQTVARCRAAERSEVPREAMEPPLQAIGLSLKSGHPQSFHSKSTSHSASSQPLNSENIQEFQPVIFFLRVTNGIQHDKKRLKNIKKCLANISQMKFMFTNDS